MSATIKNPGIKNNNKNVVPIKTINGVKFVRFDYCNDKHDHYISINGITYYDISK